MVFVFISGCYCLFFQVGLYTAVRFARPELPCRGRSCVVFSNNVDKQDFPPYIPMWHTLHKLTPYSQLAQFRDKGYKTVKNAAGFKGGTAADPGDACLNYSTIYPGKGVHEIVSWSHIMSFIGHLSSVALKPKRARIQLFTLRASCFVVPTNLCIFLSFGL